MKLKWFKASPVLDIAEPTDIIEVPQESGPQKNYYIAMGYASRGDETFRPALIAICIGYDISEASENCVYLKGAMGYAERTQSTLPGPVWEKMDALWDEIKDRMETLDDLPEDQPQLDNFQLAKEQLNDQAAMKILERLDASRLYYLVSIQVPGLTVAEALFRIPTAEVFGVGEREAAHPNWNAKNPFGQGDMDKSHDWKLPKNDDAPSDPERTGPPSGRPPGGSKGTDNIYEDRHPTKTYMGQPNIDYPTTSNPSTSGESI